MNSRPDWPCPMGHGIQFGSRDRCRDCPARRPRSGADILEARPGDWVCPKCGDVQFARNPICRTYCCNTPKPTQANKPASAPPPMLRAGDWLCAKCNDVQFASRNQCRKCGASKPAVDKPDDDLEGTCLICNERVRNAGLLHGDTVHTVTCIECADSLMKSENKTCPMCRQPIEKVVKTFN